MARSFIFGEGQKYRTPEELSKARAVANAMILNREAPKDVGSGLNAIGQALLYRSMMNDIDASAEEGRASADAAFNPVAAALGGPGAFPPAPGDDGSLKVTEAIFGSDASNPASYRDAIASIESAGSGDYSALGPVTKNGDRAYGRYQVMGKNVGPWTQAALGKQMTPKQFLADQKAQDAVVDHVLGGYVKQFGLEGGAQAWFGGPGSVGKTGRKDILGTSVGSYGRKFMAALGRGGQAQRPTQVASLNPSLGMQQTGNADPYSLIPARDTLGEDQRAKFQQWNSDPVGNNATNMASIDPALQKVVERAKEIAGTDFVIGSGKRDDAQQKRAVQFGWSGTINSDHVGGGAADLWPVDAQGRVNFDPRKQAQIVDAMKQAAQELGVDMEAGADWRKADVPHFGMIGQTPLDNPPLPVYRPEQSAQVASLDPSISVPRQQTAAPPLPAPRTIQDRPIADMPQQAVPQPPQQVAQAGQFDPSRLPAAAGGNADTFNASQGPSMQMLLNAANQPFLSDIQSAVINNLLQQQMDARHPLRQLQLKRLQRDIDTPQRNWQKLDENTLFDPNSGEIKRVNGDQAPGSFKGNSDEAQALHGLMKTNQLTLNQAMQLAAGKTVTDPSTGAIIFMTQQGIFVQPAQGAPARPISPSPVQPPASIQVTPGKPEEQMNKEQAEAATFADRMREASRVVASVPEAGLSAWGQAITDNQYIPDLAEGWLTSGDFQKFAQARRNFINAQLRRESDAVISPSEFADANKQYFPMPGNTPEVLAQKASNRQTVMEGMARAAGPGYQKGAVEQPLPDGVVDWRTYFGKGAR